MDFCLESSQARGLASSRLLLQVGNAIFVNAQFRVCREASIDFGGKRRQLCFQLCAELLRRSRHAKSVAVIGKAWIACCPWQELGPIVAEILCPSHIDITDLQRVGQMDKDANLKGASTEYIGIRQPLDDEALPSLRGKSNIDVFFQIIADFSGRFLAFQSLGRPVVNIFSLRYSSSRRP
jgi:hypothetical protein